MIAREDGAAPVYILGTALMVLLLVLGLGLADAYRASIIKTRAERALLAAVQSAARLNPKDGAAVRKAFGEVLDANLADMPHTADLALLAVGGLDPLTGREFDRPTVSARLEMPFHMEYLGKWLPAVKLELFHAEPFVANRKPAP